MSQGSPEEYAQAVEAEHADIALDYPGRGKLDVHAAVANTLMFHEIISRQPDIEASLQQGRAALAAHERAEKRQHIGERAGTILSNFIQRVGEKIPAPVIETKDGQFITIPVSYF